MNQCNRVEPAARDRIRHVYDVKLPPKWEIEVLTSVLVHMAAFNSCIRKCTTVYIKTNLQILPIIFYSAPTWGNVWKNGSCERSPGGVSETANVGGGYQVLYINWTHREGIFITCQQSVNYRKCRTINRTCLGHGL